jgi:hypothetical protein
VHYTTLLIKEKKKIYITDIPHLEESIVVANRFNEEIYDLHHIY